MRITALLENTARREDMLTEHGLSLYIETETHRILFDMGQTDLFLKNARTLGISPEEVDLAVLSHGHYDHGGGLRAFMEVNRQAPIYLHRDAFLPHYHGWEKYIGLDRSLADDPRLIFTDDRCKIAPTLTLLTCNERTRKRPPIPSGLSEQVGDRLIEDDFRHEQYLLIEEKGRRVLISGCSHKGITELVEWIAPDVLIGGFHYSKLPLDGALAQLAAELDAHPTEYYTCHCTGEAQYAFMKQYMRRLRYLSCGESIEI